MSQLNVGTINATNVTATGEVDVDATLKLPQKTTAQLPTSGVVAGEMVQNTTTNKTSTTFNTLKLGEEHGKNTVRQMLKQIGTIW